MTRLDRWGRAGVAVLLGLTLWACGPTAEEKAKREMAAQQEVEWTWLQQAKSELDAKRQQLAALGAEAPAQEVEAAEAAVAAVQDEFTGRLAEFINSLGLVQGEAPTGRALEAIRMKSAEDVVLAEEYIQKGGEYQRAIDILGSALGVDPDNAAVKAALDKAEADRYPSREKFAGLKKGMSEAEVLALLGPVNLRNVKEYPERGVVAWFYKKADGGASAVYFDKGRRQDTPLKVYDFKYDAIQAGEEG